MRYTIVLILLSFSVFQCAQGARILGVFPLPGISHNILCSKLVKGLVKAGHDVTMVTPIPTTDVPKEGKYTEILVDDLVTMFQAMLGGSLFDMNKQNPIQMMTFMTKMFLGFTNGTIHHPKVKQLLQSNQKFDAVILEQFSNDALKVFAHIYDCPLILLSSIGPNVWINPTVGNPQPPSTIPHLLMSPTSFSNGPTFFARTQNLLTHVAYYFVNKYYTLAKHDEVMHQVFPDAPPLEDLCTNVSLVLLNSHTSMYSAVPTVPNMVEIGGYFIDPPKKLPKDLQEFLDSAKEGVVYFSMGSNLKSKDLPQEKKQMILNVLGRLKEKVLWKFEDDLPNKPKNIMIRKWLPQQDILAHPNIKLFITHGGLLSTTETIYHGVPILAIPVFGDQSANAERAVAGGYGLKMEYLDPEFSEEKLRSLVNELLTNPRYRQNAQLRSKLYHDRPMEPMKTAVYWVEYVIRNKGAPHLRVAGVRMPWYQYFMVDVIAFLFLSIFTVLAVLKMAITRLCCRRASSSKIAQKQKTN